ncbi:hypothetical protein AFUB_080100 [Aspergillus fumigatus A1163]|uniref:Uncharacterized protein n=1 Tax=Aspergillus fumigatus (strain CBS 144.89 / FGSC A1163 / CEA10) TaxID=451804 RepID=B0Y982_ASPFC|nr:hypothetical protein AFUB_080100 [Aspergillus fumigatus A1163]
MINYEQASGPLGLRLNCAQLRSTVWSAYIEGLSNHSGTSILFWPSYSEVRLSLFLVQNTNVLAFWDKSSLVATHAPRVGSVA